MFEGSNYNLTIDIIWICKYIPKNLAKQGATTRTVIKYVLMALFMNRRDGNPQELLYQEIYLYKKLH